MHLQSLFRRIRRIGLFHKLGYLRVAVRCLLHPLPPRGRFPEASQAMKKPAGLVALGGRVTAATVREAHRKGIYAMYYRRPVKWWSPEPRIVIVLERMMIPPRGFGMLVRKGTYRVSFDTCFEQVIRQCAARERTWLAEDIIASFIDLHREGDAHSAEVWDGEGRLVGGIYGVATGTVFSTESAFQHAGDAIRVAFVHLNCHLQHWGYRVNDMQMPSRLADSLGAEPISRADYCALLAEPADLRSCVGPWRVDGQLDVAAWIPASPGSQVRRSTG